MKLWDLVGMSYQSIVLGICLGIDFDVITISRNDEYPNRH